MVQAQIQLFLNASGRKAFPNWLRFFGKVVRQFKGFVNIQLLQVEGSSSLGLVLIFETKASQNVFFESPVFKQLMSRMAADSIQPYRKVVLRAKNLYDYKKGSKPSQLAKAPAKTAQKIVQPKAEAMKVPLKKPAQEKKSAQQKKLAQKPEDHNVVGMAEFMAMRKQN